MNNKNTFFVNKYVFIGIILLFFVSIFFFIHRPRVKVFHNCSQLEQAGHFNIQKGSKFYEPQLDADKDGVACER